MRGELHGHKILAALAAGPMTGPRLAQSMGVKLSNINHAMLQLIDRGEIVCTGKCKHYVYQLKVDVEPRPVTSVWDYAKRGGL